MYARHVSPIVTKEFGKRHRKIRIANGRTQVGASKAYKVSQGTISKLENGKTSAALRHVSVRRMSRFLGVTADKLFV